jgi:beta-1,4-mannosyltransferase
VRVVASPGIVTGSSNRYITQLYTHLGELGVTVEDFSHARVAAGGIDIWHLHFPEFLLNRRNPLPVVQEMGRQWRTMSRARSKGVRVMWTAHNDRAHEGFHPWLERSFWMDFTKRLDGWISLSSVGRSAIERRFPHTKDVQSFVIPHGHYRGAYPAEVSRAEARSKLGIPEAAHVTSFIGRIRTYKNVPELIQAFVSLPGEHHRLVVAGKPHQRDLALSIQAAAEADARIAPHLRYIPDDEVQLFLKATDLVALPYSEVFNSGSALLALSFDRPVLAPRQGALAELEERVGQDWIKLYDGPLTTAVLESGLRWCLRPRPNRPDLQAFDWHRIAEQTALAYQEIRTGSTDALASGQVNR